MFRTPETKYSVRPEFLASDHFTSQTCQVTQAMGTVIDGRTIVKGGTIFPANDTTAIGIIIHDVDVTNGDAPAAYMDHGFVYENRLPVAPAAAAKTALKGITFRTYK